MTISSERDEGGYLGRPGMCGPEHVPARSGQHSTAAHWMSPVDLAIAQIESYAAGRTRWEGQEPRVDEVLVAEIKRLRDALADQQATRYLALRTIADFPIYSDSLGTAIAFKKIAFDALNLPEARVSA